MSTRFDYIRIIFSNIDLRYRSRIADEVEEMFNTEFQEKDVYHAEPRTEDLERALQVLEEELKKAQKILKSARTKHKKGIVTSEEVEDHSNYVNELIYQIETIKSKLP